MCQKSLSGQIRSHCKKLIARRTNLIVMHRLRTSYYDALLCHNLLSGQIRSYCKKLIASRTNRIVMPLRRCVIRPRLDKSDRIGIETCYVFHCSAISSWDTFEIAVSILLREKDLGGKFRCNTPVKHNRNSCSEKIWHITPTPRGCQHYHSTRLKANVRTTLDKQAILQHFKKSKQRRLL